MGNSITDNTKTDAGMDLTLPVENYCRICAKELCLRQRVINLAVGETEVMYCLTCLSKRDNIERDKLLVKSKRYILVRQCFSKEWIKYKDVSDCPDRNTCLPDICFSQ